jgi:hypothetical protein
MVENRSRFLLQPRILMSSRLLEYEVWSRIWACTGAVPGWRSDTRRAPSGKRNFIRDGGESVKLANYDNRLIAAAQALGIALVALA